MFEIRIFEIALVIRENIHLHYAFLYLLSVLFRLWELSGKKVSIVAHYAISLFVILAFSVFVFRICVQILPIHSYCSRFTLYMDQEYKGLISSAVSPAAVNDLMIPLYRPLRRIRNSNPIQDLDKPKCLNRF